MGNTTVAMFTFLSVQAVQTLKYGLVRALLCSGMIHISL